MVPSIAVMPREGSVALAVFGRMRKVQEPSFSVSAGRKSFALNRILDAVLVTYLILLGSGLPNATLRRKSVRLTGSYTALRN